MCSSSSLLLWSKRQRPGSTLVLWHLEGSIFRGEEGAFQDYQSLVREEMCYSQTGSFDQKVFKSEIILGSMNITLKVLTCALIRIYPPNIP